LGILGAYIRAPSRAFFGVIQNLVNARFVYGPITSAETLDMNTRGLLIFGIFLAGYFPVHSQQGVSSSQTQATFQAEQQLVEQAREAAGRGDLLAVDRAERLYCEAVRMLWFGGPWAGELPLYRKIGAGYAVRESHGLFYPSENVGETLII
jgi:hypothetical protein